MPTEDPSQALKAQRPPLPPRSLRQSGLLVCARRWRAEQGGGEAPLPCAAPRGPLVGAAPATSRFSRCGPRAQISSVPARGSRRVPKAEDPEAGAGPGASPQKRRTSECRAPSRGRAGRRLEPRSWELEVRGSLGTAEAAATSPGGNE